MIKILHAGDIHLDSPFYSLTPDCAELRRAEFRSTFTSLMTHARTGSFDLVLIAGDMFDVRYVTRETVSLIVGEMAKVSCPIFISPGNHDPYTEDSVWKRIKLPDNVRVFSSENVGCYTLPEIGVTVYGYAFTEGRMNYSPIEGKRVENKDNINILLAHGDMASKQSPYSPLNEKLIEEFGADYTALGHIHNPENYIGEAGECVYAYCGCLEGRSFDECGEKGAIDVCIDKKDGKVNVTMHQVKFSKRHYEIASVDVTGAQSLRDVISIVSPAIVSYDDRTMLRLKLCGTVDKSLVISPSVIEREFPKLYYIQVEDETLPLLGSDYLEHDLSVKGEFYRILKPMLEGESESDRETALRALRYMNAAVSGESITDI